MSDARFPRAEVTFIGHCDDGSCDLGRVEYKCPVCKRPVTDYDIWWHHDEILKGGEHKFQCDHCRRVLVFTYHADLFGIWCEAVPYAPV